MAVDVPLFVYWDRDSYWERLVGLSRSSGQLYIFRATLAYCDVGQPL